MYNHFRPKPGRYGTHPQFLTVQPTPTLTANNTTIFKIPSPYRRCVFVRGAVSVTQVPVDGDGTILGTFRKYDASADAAVTLTGNIDLETLVTREVSYADPSSSATQAQLTLDNGDVMEFHVVNNSAAINTQPTDLSLCVELLVLE